MIAKSGDFDLRGYEIVRAQSFASASMTSVSFSNNGIRFSSACIRKLAQTEYVELKIHPFTHEIAVLPCSEQFRQKMRWARIYADCISARTISASAYLKTLYEIFGWDMDKRYRLRGEVVHNAGSVMAIFDARKPEIFTSRCDMTMLWATGFGDDYYGYRESQNRAPLTNDNVSEYDNDPDLHPTTQEKADDIIRMITNKLYRDTRYSDASTDILS